jgi:hypothetical protein
MSAQNGGDAVDAGRRRQPHAVCVSVRHDHMTEPRAVTHYSAFLQVIRERIVELDITYRTVDALAGFTETYTSKLLAPVPLKRMSVDALFSIMGAVGLVPEFKHDGAAVARLRAQSDWQKRKRHDKPKSVSIGGEHKPVTVYLSPDFMREISAKAAYARMEKISPTKRKRYARKAARARWKRIVA